MRILKHYITIYILLVSQFFKIRMQYRTDFLISSIGTVFRDLSGIVALWIIFKSIPLLSGWNYYELIFLYGFSMLSMVPLQIFFDHTWPLRKYLADGSFIKYYFRPMNMMFCYMADRFEPKGINQLVIAIIAIVYASIKLHIQWTFYKTMLFVSLFMSASLVMISLMILASSSAFWIINSRSILMFVFNLKNFTRYPLTIFNSFFKFLFTYVVPIGFAAYYPVFIMLRPDEAGWYIFFTPVAGIILFTLSYLVWLKGVTSYSGTGS